jgi:hypothetical protein
MHLKLRGAGHTHPLQAEKLRADGIPRAHCQLLEKIVERNGVVFWWQDLVARVHIGGAEAAPHAMPRVALLHLVVEA